MASVNTYLNFEGNTEEAFEFYRSVFGTEYASPIFRYGDGPTAEGNPPIPDAMKNKVLNVCLPITGGHLLMGTDVAPGYGPPLVTGNNVSIVLRPDSKEEADTLFAGLSEGGEISMPMADQFWGDYYGAFTDTFGIPWMIAYTPAR